jgi:hypothetical protein
MKKQKLILLSLMVVSILLTAMSCYIMIICEEKDEFVLSILAAYLSIYLGILSAIDYDTLLKKGSGNRVL